MRERGEDVLHEEEHRVEDEALYGGREVRQLCASGGQDALAACSEVSANERREI